MKPAPAPLKFHKSVAEIMLEFDKRYKNRYWNMKDKKATSWRNKSITVANEVSVELGVEAFPSANLDGSNFYIEINKLQDDYLLRNF